MANERRYTIAYVDPDGDLSIITFGNDLDGAKEQLAKLAANRARLFTTEPLLHRLHSEPTVEIITELPATRRRRKTKQLALAGAK